ncbi:sensor histidine kinase [Chitinophaga lutea]|nr:PAS domain S-box protein [Chitinophaga lutea]
MAEQQETQSLISFDALFKNATIGILVTDAHGKIVLTNPFLLTQFGYAEEELVGQLVEKLIPARFGHRHVGHREKFHSQPRSRPMGAGLELFGVKKDGVEIAVEVSLGAYNTGNGDYVIAFVSDISYRKESENELKRLNAELEMKVAERTESLSETVKKLGEQMKEVQAKDSELQRVNGFLSSIWNHAEAIIIATDNEGIIKLFNPTAQQQLGYTAEEVVNRHSLTLFHDEGEVAERAALFSSQLKQEVLPGFDTIVAKARQNLPSELEWQYLGKDGSRFPVTLTVSALRDGDGLISGYLGIAIDISERKQAENELRLALEKERELNELKSRFVSLASHEFRTPLSTILSSTFLVSRYKRAEEQEQREKHTQRIVSSVNMLTDILNDFLSVGKIEEGKIQVRYADFDVKQHVTNIIAEMQGLRKAQQLVEYHHEGDVQLSLDPALLKHIVMNLLSNAIKFSPSGTLIQVDTRCAGQQFSLKIRDRGAGISKEDQQHLFERFFRGSNADDVQGTGLGLHIVAKYAELMNGSITCESELGKGTTFTVLFNL